MFAKNSLGYMMYLNFTNLYGVAYSYMFRELSFEKIKIHDFKVKKDFMN